MKNIHARQTLKKIPRSHPYNFSNGLSLKL